MKGMLKYGIFVCLFLVGTMVLCAETVLHVKGESLTPAGITVSLIWQVRGENNRYRFYLDNQLKAEMVLEAGSVVKIRRRIRFAGKDKWIVLTDPRQISIELKSGFYPFGAVLNYRNRQSRKTVMVTGKFEIMRSAVQ